MKTGAASMIRRDHVLESQRQANIVGYSGQIREVGRTSCMSRLRATVSEALAAEEMIVDRWCDVPKVPCKILSG